MVPDDQKTAYIVIGYGGTGEYFVRTPLGIALVNACGTPVSMTTPEAAPTLEQEPDPPPPVKKSWHREQRELPKFLREKRRYL